MKIRTQLILAFILLSVVPLSGIVLDSCAGALVVAKGRESQSGGRRLAAQPGRATALS